MIAQELYKDLQTADEKSIPIILSRVFTLVFNRHLRTNEWGFFRKLVRIYGGEIVYWAILGSVRVNSTGNVLPYVSKVCSGISKEQAEIKVPPSDILSLRTEQKLREAREFIRPDWSSILGEHS